ncbi:hypothetical protein FL966_01625 [Caproiciproducens galactitolivorans]|uniref:Uncharacterized protein n=1 Tax=Caproiciproducens galactitolivorans TaxID=642589 RepID=A0A4Z0Y8D9_9FIRM|nr:hypothetical protein [Caproiciproducens galactitolivorans]QEY33846.1 hypothetical protein FL966_01625 [Caproiciproducens galactitolivorans]TGJ75541.1 hypothetical protein CAGA_23410 [Caproiciproducens galactitolivorans]
MTKDEEAKFDKEAALHFGQDDICPIMSVGRKSPALCVKGCAWYDTETKECTMSRINANLKWLKDIAK